MEFFLNKFSNCILILALLFLTTNSYAQCAGCTVTITNSTSSYTASNGQVLCIASGLTYTGTVVLDGGTLCNSGTVKNITFLRGTFSNYGTYTGGNLSLAVTGNLTIDSYNGSSISVGSLVYTSSSSYQTNITVFKGATATFTSDVTQNAGILNLIVNRDNPSSNPVQTSTLNFNALLTSKRDNFSLFVYDNGSVIINNVASLEGAGIKSITNYGIVKFNRDLNMISSGSSSSTVTINNYKQMDLLLGLNASYTAGKVFINNNLASSIINVANSITLSKATNTLTNVGNITVTQNFNVQNGVAINSGTITNNAVSITGGTLTNNNSITTNTTFAVSTSTAYFINNGFTNVVGNFTNTGVTTLGSKSMLQTNNYYNLSGSITGPLTVPDTLSYAKIIIKSFSENDTYISGKIIVNDQTLTGTANNNGFGFDNIINTGDYIAPEVLFINKSVGPGIPIQPNCSLFVGVYALFSNPNIYTPVMEGTPVTLTAEFDQISYNQYGVVYTPVTSPPITYNWQPTGQVGISIVLTPPSTVTYTVSIMYQGCPFTSIVTVTVLNPPYGVLKRSVDGGYYQVSAAMGNKLFFKYDGEYKNNPSFAYKIYKPDRTLLVSSLTNNLVSNYGDNRFSINLPAYVGASNTYYTLEVTNEKKELFYLKFKY